MTEKNTAIDSEDVKSHKRGWLISVIILLLLIATVVGGHFAYQALTGLPDKVRFATGTAGGRYRSLMEELGRKLAARTKIKVEFVATDGSLDNIQKLENGAVDFALFQTGAQVLREKPSSESNARELRSVANVYSEVVHIFVREDAGVETLSQLKGKVVSIGGKFSGDNVSARIILQHLGIELDEITVRELDYHAVHNEFKAGQLDAAFVTVGLGADKIQEIIHDANVKIMKLPYANRLTTRNLSVQDASIPAAMYQVDPTPIPPASVETISMRAQLLTRNDVSAELVEEITAILMAQDFQREQRLRELFESGAEFARSSTLYQLHDGAAHHFDPELKPWLPPDFVEATEGLRSFVVSILIAAYLAIRWFKQHRLRRSEHQLDSFLRLLLQIELRQMDLDEGVGMSDIEQLQRLLDEVTELRQEALGSLSAHELSDDSSAAVFIQMCHALSDKINAKLSRQRIDVRLAELIETISPAQTELPSSDPAAESE